MKEEGGEGIVFDLLAWKEIEGMRIRPLEMRGIEKRAWTEIEGMYSLLVGRGI